VSPFLKKLSTKKRNIIQIFGLLILPVYLINVPGHYSRKYGICFLLAAMEKPSGLEMSL
jgi:hypothetical protein